jgi:hypothetical protein
MIIRKQVKGVSIGFHQLLKRFLFSATRSASIFFITWHRLINNSYTKGSVLVLFGRFLILIKRRWMASKKWVSSCGARSLILGFVAGGGRFVHDNSLYMSSWLYSTFLCEKRKKKLYTKNYLLALKLELNAKFCYWHALLHSTNVQMQFNAVKLYGLIYKISQIW